MVCRIFSIAIPKIHRIVNLSLTKYLYLIIPPALKHTLIYFLLFVEIKFKIGNTILHIVNNFINNKMTKI